MEMQEHASKNPILGFLAVGTEGNRRKWRDSRAEKTHTMREREREKKRDVSTLRV